MHVYLRWHFCVLIIYRTVRLLQFKLSRQWVSLSTNMKLTLKRGNQLDIFKWNPCNVKLKFQSDVKILQVRTSVFVCYNEQVLSKLVIKHSTLIEVPNV